ncbi:hypothetical protein SATRM34S_01531 [Streptomyces atroolivaceus]
MVCTLRGLPDAFALTDRKPTECETLVALFEVEPGLLTRRRRIATRRDTNGIGRGEAASATTLRKG